jgi:tetratricopeptide (TPR) repeat protein
MTIVIVLITGCVSAMFTVGKQYVAQAQFSSARAAQTPEEFGTLVAQAYQQYADDGFAIASAQVKLAQLRSMLSIEKPSEEEQKVFVNLAVSAVADAEQAIKLDPSNPAGHATLASILIILSGVGFEDAENRANSKLEDAKWRDPLNPTYAMMAAYMAIQNDDSKLAREKITQALELKRNYSEALFLLSQIDIKEGNIESAITTTRQMTTLEPNNPTRYYQLGVLLAANKDLEGAVDAYEAAIAFDSNFANARYMMSLALLDLGRTPDALTQLKLVKETNQDNQQLAAFINQIETTGYTPGQGTGLGGAVNEATPQEQQNGETVTAPGETNTDLVTPVNTVNEEQSAAGAAPQETPVQ